MKNKGVYLFAGESGNGKTSIVEELEKRYKFKSIQSYSTRPKRSENETGHIFIAEDEFDELTDLVAYTKFNGYRYCATSKQVEECDTYVIDPFGIEYFKNHYHGNKVPIVIYIRASLKDRILRMQKRGDNDSQIIQRVLNDIDAFKNIKDLADMIIDNDDFEQCVED
jgi:guanylate kinase